MSLYQAVQRIYDRPTNSSQGTAGSIYYGYAVVARGLEMLRQDTDEEWQELEPLLQQDPRRGMYRFQTQPNRRYLRFARWMVLPLGIPVLICWLIWGPSSPVTGIFLVLLVVAGVVCLVGLVVSFRYAVVRQRLIKKYAAEFNSEVPNDQSERWYAAGQKWVIKRCLDEERERFGGTRHRST